MSTNPATALEVLVRAVYRHFQGELVQVVRMVEHAETNETLVLYSSLNNPGIWKVTSISDFTGRVNTDVGLISRYSLTDINIGTTGGLLVV